MTVGVIFPGQGSQQVGAGRPWVRRPEWAVVERAEELLDRPLAHLLLDASADDLRSTASSQLSVLLASLVAWTATRTVLGEGPQVMAGHSLGQVTALLASGAVAEPDGLRFAAARADATQRAAEARPGVMAALLGATEDQAADACEAAPDACWLANLNAPGQLVIAGTPEGVATASSRAQENGVRRIRRLEVGGAFHTPLMSGAAADLTAALDGLTFTAPEAPIVTNHDAVAHGGADGWPERLATHVVSPVRWADSVRAMVGMGVDRFVEVGPGTALTGLLRRIAPEATAVHISEPADVAAVATMVGAGR
jgi:[acyl-carrier-protein] S-malonyltransferase